MPTARVTPGLCRPIRALLSLFLILSTFRIGEARVPGPDTWNLWICNPSGLQEKHYILSSVRADVVAISETHLSQSAKRNLELSFRSSQYISVSLQTCPHRSLFASQIDLLRRRPMEWSLICLCLSLQGHCCALATGLVQYRPFAVRCFLYPCRLDFRFGCVWLS